MKVEIKLQPELKLPFAVIHTGEVTAEVQRAAAMLSEERAALISAGEDDKIVMLHPEDIYLVRVEAEKTVIHGDKSSTEAANGSMNWRPCWGRILCAFPKAQSSTCTCSIMSPPASAASWFWL